MDSLKDLMLVIEQLDIKANGDILDTSHHLIQQASALACDLFIDSNGRCNWDNINIFRNMGYPVFPVERDSFGWLIGGIGLINGVITFG